MYKNNEDDVRLRKKAIFCFLTCIVTLFLCWISNLHSQHSEAKAPEANASTIEQVHSLAILKPAVTSGEMTLKPVVCIETTITTTSTTTTTCCTTNITTTTSTVQTTLPSESIYDEFIETDPALYEEVSCDIYMETAEDTYEEYYTPSVSDSDFILLCNAVGHEAGGCNIGITDKAKVVEVIMNRVYSANYPNSVYEVLTQQGQFTGAWSYVDLGAYSSKVSQEVIDSVNYYFTNVEEFQHGYLSFWGDGYQNHFS